MNKGVRNTAFYLIQILVSGIIMIILLPIMAHQLEPSELGQFVLAQVYAGVAVGLSNFGLLAGYERNFFYYEKSNSQSAKLIYSALTFVLINILLLIFFVHTYQLDINRLIFSDIPPDDLLFIVLIGSATASLSQYYLTFLKNSGLAKRYMMFALLQSIMNFSIVILLLFMSNLKVLSLAYAWLLSNLFLFMALSVMHIKVLPLGFNKEVLKDMLRISVPLTPSVFFGFISTKFDKIMLGFIASTGAVGVYNIGQTLSLTIFQFMTGLGRVFQPEVYRKLFNGEHKTQSGALSNYILPFFYFSIFVALLVALFAKELVFVFFPADYFDAIGVIVVLSVYYASLFFGKIVGPQLIFAKKTYTVTFLTLIGIFVNAGLNIPFIIKWGITGAAWATTITGILMTTIGYFVAQKYIRIFWHWRLFFTLYAVFLLGVVWALIDYNYLTNLSHIVVIFSKLLIIFLYIFLGFRLTIVDRNSIKLIFTSLKFRLRGG